MYQTSFDFTSAAIHKENNRESQTYLEDNAEHFGKQDRDVYNHLKRGLSINPDSAFELYGIRHLARRICTIRQILDVKDKRLPNGCKEYFL